MEIVAVRSPWDRRVTSAGEWTRCDLSAGWAPSVPGAVGSGQA